MSYLKLAPEKPYGGLGEYIFYQEGEFVCSVLESGSGYRGWACVCEMKRERIRSTIYTRFEHEWTGLAFYLDPGLTWIRP